MVAFCLRLANLSRVTSRLLSRSTASRSTRRPRRSSNVSEATAGCCSLLLERFGHADEAEGDEPVVCGMWKHVSFLSLLFARSFSSRAAACGPPGARDHPGVAQW